MGGSIVARCPDGDGARGALTGGGRAGGRAGGRIRGAGDQQAAHCAASGLQARAPSSIKELESLQKHGNRLQFCGWALSRVGVRPHVV